MLRFRLIKPRYLISIHQPLDGVDTTDGGAREPAFSARLAHNLRLPLKAFRCWSFCHGSMTGWVTNHQRGVAVTVEFAGTAPQSLLRTIAPRALIASLPSAHYARADERNPVTTLQPAQLTTADNGRAGIGQTGSVVRLTGTSYDPDRRTGPLSVAVTEGSRIVARAVTSSLSAALDRQAVLAGRHGYTVQFIAAPGVHRYCVTGANVGAGTVHPRPVCTTVRVGGSSYGRLDSATVNPDGTIAVTGWAVNPNHSAGPTSVTLSLTATGPGASSQMLVVAANQARLDVAAAYRITGSHGFAVTVPAGPSGDYELCATAQGLTPGPATTLGCRAVTIP